MSMQPRGKVKLLIDAMQADPSHVVWTPAEAASVMGITKQAVSSHLQPAFRRGWLFKSVENRQLRFSLQGPEEEPAQFTAALWADGDLVLNGVQISEDGGVLLTREQVVQVKRLLLGQVLDP